MLGLILVGWSGACGNARTATRPATAVKAPPAAADAGSDAAPARKAASLVPVLAYPPLACTEVSYTNKRPRRFEEMPCDDARRRRDAYLDILRTTGELPRTLHEGATASNALGKVVEEELVQLSADGAAGALIIAVDLNAKVKWAIAGAFSRPTKPFDGRRFAVEVTVPSDLAPLGWTVTDIVSRDDLAIEARLAGLGELGYEGLFRLTASGGGPDLAATASARDAWVETLPATRGERGPVSLPDDGVALYDADTRLFRTWMPSQQEGIALTMSGISVVRLSGGAFATRVRAGRKCHGRWFEPTRTAPRPICDVQRHRNHGARIVRVSETKKSNVELVDVDDDGHELVLAALVGTLPASVEVLGTAPDQLAYVVGRRVHVETLPSAENPKRKSLDLSDSLPCRGVTTMDGGCTIEHIRLLEIGAALVHVNTPYQQKLYIASAGGWRETPMMSLQKRKDMCSVETVRHGAVTTHAVVHCGDDSPEWHLRTISANGDVTDSLPAKGDVELAELAHAAPARLKLRDEVVCAADGLLYRGPACDSLPSRSSAKGSN